MSNLQRLTNASYGIENYLRSKGLKPTTKFTSDITASFLKSKGLSYTKFNPKYKGLFTANICNAELVQENFKEFKQFVEKSEEKFKKGKKYSVSLYKNAKPISQIEESTLKKIENKYGWKIDKIKIV